MTEMVRYGCAYPRCPSTDVSKPRSVTSSIAECVGCGRLLAACNSRQCKPYETYNRPFVKHCRRCGLAVDQSALWAAAREHGWTLSPGEIGAAEALADLSHLVDPNLSARGSVAMAMIRGSLAVHLAGHALALIKAGPQPNGGGDALIWSCEGDPFPAPDSNDRVGFAPSLLPDERHLMFSGPQGLLVLDLWSCHGISAKDNAPRHRLVTMPTGRTLVGRPIALDASRVGLMLRCGDVASRTYRWAVWDRSRPPHEDAAFAETLAGDDLPDLEIDGKSCAYEVVDHRVVAIATERGHWVWRMADAGSSRVDALKRTWPLDRTKPGTMIAVNERGGETEVPQAFLTQGPVTGGAGRGFEKFSWFYTVRQSDPLAPEVVERYQVGFSSLDSEIPQQVKIRHGATPIGPASDRNAIRQMYFRLGTELWYQNDDALANSYQGSLPQTLVSLEIVGPLVLSVGEREHGGRFIQMDSLHHSGIHLDAAIDPNHTLMSDPLLWNRWLFTVERDAGGATRVFRRTLRFDEPGSVRSHVHP